MPQNGNHLTPPVGRARHSFKPGRTEYHPSAQASADLPVILEVFAELPPEERARLERISERLLEIPELGPAGVKELLYRIGQHLSQNSAAEL